MWGVDCGVTSGFDMSAVFLRESRVRSGGGALVRGLPRCRILEGFFAIITNFVARSAFAQYPPESS